MEVQEDLVEWTCGGCGTVVWDTERPAYKCFRCQESQWQPPGGSVTSEEKPTTISIEEQGYETVLALKCLEIQGDETYLMLVSVAKKLGNKALTVSASWGPLRARLMELIEAFRTGNVLHARKVHLGSGLDLENPDHRAVWKQIGSALLAILEFVREVLKDEQRAGLIMALYASGFMDKLFAYISQPKCNEAGAADLKKAVEKISFTGRD